MKLRRKMRRGLSLTLAAAMTMGNLMSVQALPQSGVSGVSISNGR